MYHRWLVGAGLLAALWAAPALAQFPDPSFADVLDYYVAQAESGTYQQGGMATYWRQRLSPVWGTLPERQQRFYLALFQLYDDVLQMRSTRRLTTAELQGLLRWSLDPTQEPAVFEANMRQFLDHLTREKARLTRRGS
jgi:hypothetical protein